MSVSDDKIDTSKQIAPAADSTRTPEFDIVNDTADIAEGLINGVAAKPASDKKSHKKSGGEIIFDRTVYTGIGFGVNEASSMIIADELRYGNNKYFGKEIFHKAAEGWVKMLKLKDKVSKDGKQITSLARAENTLEVGALLIGGTLLLLPMKWLEDRKENFVRKINHGIDKMRGRDKDDAAIQARDQEVAETIACQPKQSWTSLIIGRISAVVTNMLILSNTVFAEPRATQVKDFSEKHVTKLTVKADKMMGDKPNSALKRMMGDPTKPFEERRFPRYARIAAIETLYTVSSSVVLEIVSKLTARKKPLVHDSKLCEEAAKRRNATTPAPIPQEQEPKYAPILEAQGRKRTSHVQRLAAETDQQLQPGM